MDDDFGFDDSLGGCTINLEKLDLGAEVTAVDSVVDNKKGEGWFSRKAKIFLEMTFVE